VSRPGPRDLALAVLGPVIGRAGSAYLAGRSRADAVRVARQLLAAGHEVTIGYWNEPTDAVPVVAAESLACIADLAGAGGRAQVALKAPALGFDEAAVQEIARAAAAAQVGLLFDAHAPDQATGTLALALAAHRLGARSGIAVATRWRRSAADAQTAAAAGLSTRLVKGQWADDEPGGIPGLAGDRQLRAAFLDLLAAIPAGSPPVAIATHDAALFAAAVGAARAVGREVQLELLLGLPARRVLAVARRERVPVRCYVPYGHPSLSYSLSSTLRRPRLAANLAQGVALGAANRALRLREALDAAPGAPGR